MELQRRPAQLDAHGFLAGNSARDLEPDAPPTPANEMVGKKVPSAVGLRDMHGNVSAWVADLFVANACAAALGVEMRLNHGLQLPRDDE